MNESLGERVARAIMTARGGCDVKEWSVEAQENLHVAQAVREADAAIAIVVEEARAAAESAIREHHMIHGPAGAGWNVSALLDRTLPAILALKDKTDE